MQAWKIPQITDRQESHSCKPPEATKNRERIILVKEGTGPYTIFTLKHNVIFRKFLW